MSRIATGLALAALMSFMSPGQADSTRYYEFTQVKPHKDHAHHNGHELIKGKLATNGKHVLHKSDNHHAHAHAENGKIAKVTAHDPKGKDLKVVKLKSMQKHHA